MSLVAVVLVAALVGLAGGYFYSRRGAEAQAAAAEAEAQRRSAQAEAQRQQMVLEARHEASLVTSHAEAEADLLRDDLDLELERLRGKEETLQRRLEAYDAHERALVERDSEIKARLGDVDRIRRDQIEELQRVSSLSHDEATAQIFSRVEAEVREEGGRRAR